MTNGSSTQNNFMCTRFYCIINICTYLYYSFKYSTKNIQSYNTWHIRRTDNRFEKNIPGACATLSPLKIVSN